jgi:hypothetical protein
MGGGAPLGLPQGIPQGLPQGIPSRGLPPQGLPGPPSQLPSMMSNGGQAMPPNLPQIPGPPGGIGPQGIGLQAQGGGGLPVQGSMGGNLSNLLARIGSVAPTPPINPVVDIQDNIPPIVREAIRRRLFTQGM